MIVFVQYTFSEREREFTHEYTTSLITTGTSAMTPAVAQLALDKLCPAVYALLSDGLHPSLQSLFGKINNSVWRVIEVTSQISELKWTLLLILVILSWCSGTMRSLGSCGSLRV